jgi:hypothetical protein
LAIRIEANLFGEIDEKISHMELDESNSWGELASQALRDEIKGRVSLLLPHFEMKYPDNEDDWLALVFEVCAAGEAGLLFFVELPGFRFANRGLGAGQKWTEQLNRELLSEVEKLTKKGMTDHAAWARRQRPARPKCPTERSKCLKDRQSPCPPRRIRPHAIFAAFAKVWVFDCGCGSRCFDFQTG